MYVCAYVGMYERCTGVLCLRNSFSTQLNTLFINQEKKICVRGFLTYTTKDALINYFENTKRSNGADVQDVTIQGETAVITFADREGMGGILDAVRSTITTKAHPYNKYNYYMADWFCVL